MKKLCFTTIVHGWSYQKYIPLFVYSCLKAYPDTTVRLFLTNNIHQDFYGALEYIKDMGDFQIEQNWFKRYPKDNQPLKTIRWVLPEDLFMDFDCVYIGDIDIFMCREAPSLLEQHLGHCIKHNLPYSNMVRPNSTRLSGLHFVKRKEYYSIMSPVIEKYDRLLRNKQITKKNEMVLYDMVKESGMEFPSDHFRPHHGLHLGLWRSGPRPLTKKHWDGIGGKETYRMYWEWFKKVEKDPMFKIIEGVFPSKEIDSMRQAMRGEFG